MARSRNQASSGAVGVPRVQAVQSAARILWTVGHSGARGMTLNQLAQAVEVPKSTVLRIAQTLVDEGLLEREESTGLFRLGIRTLELASMVLETLEIPRVARPHLEWLSEQTRETVHLCVLDEGEVVYVDKIESPQAIRLYSRIGRRAPAHCTGVGKALMAFLPSTERRRLVEKRPLKRFTPNTITDFFQLEKELEQIRQTGIADHREEHEPGVRCAAAPVFRPDRAGLRRGQRGGAHPSAAPWASGGAGRPGQAGDPGHLRGSGLPGPRQAIGGVQAGRQAGTVRGSVGSAPAWKPALAAM